MEFRPVHLCIIQPLGYVHSLGFLDQARYLRYQFRRFGVDVTIAKNRLKHGAVNVVLGAHLGFDPELRKRYACIFFNLEQMGEGGAQVSDAYRQLLGTSAVFDYDEGNPPHYTSYVEDVPLLSFGHAPYLDTSSIALNERPIDLLFFGSMNERRRRIIQEIEDAGGHVTLLDGPVYGPERDALIRQSKAVLNCHYYESARFEQARVFQCLSLGTPVISERLAATRPAAQFENAVFWVPEGGWQAFIRGQFLSEGFASAAQHKLQSFQQHDLVEGYADAFVFAQSFAAAHLERIASGPWTPDRLHIGSGKDYRNGWLNVDILPAALPDVILDLGQKQSWPQRLCSDTVGEVDLLPGAVKLIYANNVLEHVPDLPTFMGNCLMLLEEGGRMEIEVPYEHANTAWQDPTHIRAMNEASWVYYADWFWYLGWFEHRFHLQDFAYLDAALKPCGKEGANFMRVTLVKQPTTLAERMAARTMQADFGGVPEDADLDDMV